MLVSVCSSFSLVSHSATISLRKRVLLHLESSQVVNRSKCKRCKLMYAITRELFFVIDDR